MLGRFGAEVPRAAARRFNQVAWTAFAVLVIAGVWNIVAVRGKISPGASYRVTLIVKLIVVGASGITAACMRGPAARCPDRSQCSGRAVFSGVLLVG